MDSTCRVLDLKTEPVPKPGPCVTMCVPTSVFFPFSLFLFSFSSSFSPIFRFLYFYNGASVPHCEQHRSGVAFRVSREQSPHQNVVDAAESTACWLQMPTKTEDTRSDI